jgi:hypothetical protein
MGLTYWLVVGLKEVWGAGPDRFGITRLMIKTPEASLLDCVPFLGNPLPRTTGGSGSAPILPASVLRVKRLSPYVPHPPWR